MMHKSYMNFTHLLIHIEKAKSLMLNLVLNLINLIIWLYFIE